MSVSFANLTSGGQGTPGTSQATASVTPTANALVVLSVTATFFNSTPQPTVTSVTGNGLTWVLIDAVTDNTSGLNVRVEKWRAMGASPSAGAITINFDNSAQSAWTVDQYTGVDTGGTNGSAAVVQAVHGFGRDLSGVNPNTAPTLTLAALGNAANAVSAFFANGSGVAGTATGGYTTLSSNVTSGPPAICELAKSPGTTTPTASVATGSFEYWQGVAIEIKSAVGAASAAPSLLLTGVGQ